MILMNDFKAEPALLRTAMNAAAERVIGSAWYVLGEEVLHFEQQWAQCCGVRHAVGVGNGMDAIELILRAAGVGPGDEVITTPMTAFATVLGVLRAGATPVLADIDPATALLEPESVIRCFTPQTRAVLLVHLYGQVRQMERWKSLCTESGAALIEDCAQAHLASSRGRVAGSFGLAGAYSFYPTKNLGAIGDGGAVVTDADDLARQVSLLRNYGQSDRYVHAHIGMNSRLDELQAALLSVRLEWLESFTTRRREVAAIYDRAICNPTVELLAPPESPSAHVHHLYVLRCHARDALIAHLKNSGVQTLVHYPVPVHRQAPCASLRRDPKGLPAADAHAATCLSLPCHPQMSDDDALHVVEAVNAFAAA